MAIFEVVRPIRLGAGRTIPAGATVDGDGWRPRTISSLRNLGKIRDSRSDVAEYDIDGNEIEQGSAPSVAVAVARKRQRKVHDDGE